MEKKCTKCEKVYGEPLTNSFNRKKDTVDGLQYRCKTCMAEFHKDHYQERKDYYKRKALVSNKEYRLRNQQYMIDYLKDHPCIDCGETDPVVLEFDHRGDKRYNVSSLTVASMETLVAEIAKCDVRCANCHKRKTAQQFGFYKGILF